VGVKRITGIVRPACFRALQAAGLAAAAATGQPDLTRALPTVVDTLTGVVSSILGKHGDSCLDVFAGFYGSEHEWNCKESFAGRGVEITLNLF
jgi:hypothetical protein